MTARWYWLAMRSPANPIASNTRIAKIVGDMVLLQMCWSDPGRGQDAHGLGYLSQNRRMGANKPRGRGPKWSGACPAGDAQTNGVAGLRRDGVPCRAAMQGQWAVGAERPQSRRALSANKCGKQ